jgi:hypothetical protein
MKFQESFWDKGGGIKTEAAEQILQTDRVEKIF